LVSSGLSHGRLGLFRKELLSYVEAYLAQGNSALIVYRDKSRPVKLADEFRSSLDASLIGERSMKEFREYLEQFTKRPLPNMDTFLYWSKENFGLKPVISITHVTIDRQPRQLFIASKQIYASHYFNASLGLTAAVDGLTLRGPVCT
jgi:hypothetical protein